MLQKCSRGTGNEQQSILEGRVVLSCCRGGSADSGICRILIHHLDLPPPRGLDVEQLKAESF